jgi:hypothetical protein
VQPHLNVTKYRFKYHIVFRKVQLVSKWVPNCTLFKKSANRFKTVANCMLFEKKMQLEVPYGVAYFLWKAIWSCIFLMKSATHIKYRLLVAYFLKKCNSYRKVTHGCRKVQLIYKKNSSYTFILVKCNSYEEKVWLILKLNRISHFFWKSATYIEYSLLVAYFMRKVQLVFNFFDSCTFIIYRKTRLLINNFEKKMQLVVW